MSRQATIDVEGLSLSTEPLLELDNLSRSYGEFHALRGLTTRLEPGRIGLLGPNGAGKSTTLKNISRLLKGSSGAISFEGVSLTQLEPHQVVEL